MNNPFLRNVNPLLKLDYYKTVHSEQYPDNLEYITSYYTPRMTRIPGQDKIVMFGLQAFLQKELIDYFNEFFFQLPIEMVLEDYKRTIDYTFAPNVVNFDKVKELHELGYLPLKVSAIPEGLDFDDKMFDKYLELC